jgi:ribosomal protein S12 methylthiotransferase
LIETIASCRKVARYIDMPLQHIHPVMLERMRRETSQEYILDLIERLRTGLPGVALRTTFIVGFPGETEGCFEALLQFVRDTRFERLGVFTYSMEEGTRAAKMTAQVPDEVKQERRERLMVEQLAVARGISAGLAGRELSILVEGPATPSELEKARIHSWEHGFTRQQNPERLSLQDSYLIARSEADAPDIDGRVFVRGALPPGEFAKVKVVGHTDYDLVAEPVRREGSRKGR